MTVIIDYEAGNIGSIKNMLKKLGNDAVITSRKEDVMKASHIILPGVGAFDYGMTKLRNLGLIPLLTEKKNQGIPILGICLGAQLMCETSEEGKLEGLGWLKAKVKRFPIKNNNTKFTVPHMGWDVVTVTKNSKLFLDVPQPPRFYFVHSYYIECSNSNEVLAENVYSTKYHSGFERENIAGVQFHPEKSHKFGKQLLKNFIQNF